MRPDPINIEAVDEKGSTLTNADTLDTLMSVCQKYHDNSSELPLLLQSIIRIDMETFKEIVDKNPASIMINDGKYKLDESPLLFAVAFENRDAFDYIIRYVDSRNNFDRCTLNYYTELKCARRLAVLKHNTEWFNGINLYDLDKPIEINIAILNKDLKTIPNSLDTKEIKNLMGLVIYHSGDLKTFEILFNHVFNTLSEERKSSLGSVFLLMAAKEGHLAISTFLIEKKIEVNKTLIGTTTLEEIIKPNSDNLNLSDDTKTRIAALLLCSGARTPYGDNNNPILEAATRLLQKARAPIVLSIMNDPKLDKSPIASIPEEIKKKIAYHYSEGPAELTFQVPGSYYMGKFEVVGSDDWKDIVRNISTYEIDLPNPDIIKREAEIKRATKVLLKEERSANDRKYQRLAKRKTQDQESEENPRKRLWTDTSKDRSGFLR